MRSSIGKLRELNSLKLSSITEQEQEPDENTSTHFVNLAIRRYKNTFLNTTIISAALKSINHQYTAKDKK